MDDQKLHLIVADADGPVQGRGQGQDLAGGVVALDQDPGHAHVLEGVTLDQGLVAVQGLDHDLGHALEARAVLALLRIVGRTLQKSKTRRMGLMMTMLWKRSRWIAQGLAHDRALVLGRSQDQNRAANHVLGLVQGQWSEMEVLRSCEKIVLLLVA